MSDEEDLTTAACEVARALRVLARAQAGYPSKLLTVGELAEVVQVPARTLQEQTARGQLPHRRWGKHIRFSAEDVTAIVQLMHRAPTTMPKRRGRT